MAFGRELSLGLSRAQSGKQMPLTKTEKEVSAPAHVTLQKNQHLAKTRPWSILHNLLVHESFFLEFRELGIK